MIGKENVVQVALVDEQILWRRGIACLLKDRKGFGIAHESPTIAGLAQARFADNPPDVVIAGPGLACSAENVVHELRAVVPANRLLAVVAPGAEACAWFKADTLGYSALSTMATVEELYGAVLAVSASRRYSCPHILRSLESRTEANANARPLSTLSAREMEVLLGLLKGKRLKEIAGEMDVTQKSVHSYRTRMMVKLGLGNITELVQYALHCGLLSPGMPRANPARD
jgi:DNA-binding NarL/FixJ family response regulator